MTRIFNFKMLFLFYSSTNIDDLLYQNYVAARLRMLPFFGGVIFERFFTENVKQDMVRNLSYFAIKIEPNIQLKL